MTLASPAPEALAHETEWLGRAATSIELGGRALDPNVRGGVDLVIVRDLFATAVVALATAIDPGAPPASTRSAIDRVARDLDLPRAAGELVVRGRPLGGAFLGRQGRGRQLLGTLDAPERTLKKGDAIALEVLLLKLLEQARKKPGFGRATRLRWLGLLALAGVMLAIGAGYWWTHPWITYGYKTSSTYTGFQRAGRLGLGSGDLFFHTSEEQEPWIEIDLGKEKTISRVTVQHRRSCCTERGIPLRLEIATRPGEFVEVARKEEAFDTWDATFPEQRARWVRLHAVGKTVLHLREIQIR